MDHLWLNTLRFDQTSSGAFSQSFTSNDALNTECVHCCFHFSISFASANSGGGLFSLVSILFAVKNWMGWKTNLGHHLSGKWLLWHPPPWFQQPSQKGRTAGWLPHPWTGGHDKFKVSQSACRAGASSTSRPQGILRSPSRSKPGWKFLKDR